MSHYSKTQYISTWGTGERGSDRRNKEQSGVPAKTELPFDLEKQREHL
jgi:hypothetical protein